MVYHKKRKTDRPPRGKVNENEMRAAVNAVLNGGTVYRVSKERGINLMTLKRYVRKSLPTKKKHLYQTIF